MSVDIFDGSNDWEYPFCRAGVSSLAQMILLVLRGMGILGSVSVAGPDPVPGSPVPVPVSGFPIVLPYYLSVLPNNP